MDKYRSLLRQESSNPKGLVQNIYNDYRFKYPNKAFLFRDIIKYCEDEFLIDKDSRQFLSVLLVSEIKNQVDNHYKYNKRSKLVIGPEYFPVIYKYKSILLDGAKSAIVDIMLKNSDKLHPYIKKQMVESCYYLVPHHSSITTDFVLKFYKNMPDYIFKYLLDKIPDKDKDKIYKVLDKSKYLRHIKYDNSEILSDLEKRKELIKELANSPGFCSRINFEVAITKDDLESLPIMTRFKFIKYLFKARIYASYYLDCYNKGNRNNLQKRNFYVRRLELDEKDRKVKPTFISYKDMGKLLFPASIRKNQSISKWLHKYKKHLDVLKNIGGDLV